MENKEKGQILLIVILTVVIALTVGLSVASRTITNLKLSKQNEESQRAFQAAEAGITQALKEINAASGRDRLSQSLTNNANFSVKVNELKNTDFLLNGGQPVPQDVGVDVWLSNYPDYNYTTPQTVSPNRTLVFYWGEKGKTNCGVTSGAGVVPALQFFILSGLDKNNPSATKYLVDPCKDTRGNGASDAARGNYSVGGTQFAFSYTINNITNGLIMKVVPIYNSGLVGVISNPADLPPQGSFIESVGESGDTQRKLLYYTSYPQIPNELFQYSLLSQ